ncbi:MAG: zinc ribbon domain-containing protein [Neisseriales bacterium]|nr:MAG: zinc ribbon domain-containing protein [Neisseriales bacterium]
MPIYEYRCDVCGHKQEHWCKLGQGVTCCPRCRSATYQKCVSTPASLVSIQPERPICPTTGRTCGGCCEH